MHISFAKHYRVAVQIGGLRLVVILYENLTSLTPPYGYHGVLEYKFS